MNAMTNNHIGTEDAIGEGGRDFYRMRWCDIEGVGLEKAFIKLLGVAFAIAQLAWILLSL